VNRGRAALLALLLAAAPAAARGQEAPRRDSMFRERAERTITDLVPELVLVGGFYSGWFTGVAGVACDAATGEILVADAGANTIEIFGEGGAPLFAFSDDEHLLQPTRLAVDADGRILVLDRERDAVKVFSYRGEYQGRLSLPGLGPEARPVLTALALDRNGDLWVGDTRSGQVLAYDRQLRLRMKLGTYGDGPGQLDGIIGIALDDRHVYVASQDGMAVHVFTRQGRFVRGWGFHDAGLHNVSLPAGIAVDGKGRVILLDTLRQELKYFDAEGRLIDNFGGLGELPGALAYPTDVAVDRRGRLCVADGGNRRVQVLRPVEAEPGPVDPGDGQPAGEVPLPR
jgi:DNA-binding beta-propeller fold protein YncE